MKLAIPNLNVKTFEDVFYNINMYIHAAQSRDNIDVDISKAVFFDPYSLVNLCALLRHILKYFSVVSLTLPKDTNANNYLERINFFGSIPKEIKLPRNISASREFSSSDVLLEITPIKKQGDINNVIKYTISKIGKILQTSLGYTEKDIASFCTALSETCQNIVDHSGDQGLVCAQKYHGANWYAPTGRHPERAFVSAPTHRDVVYSRRDKETNYVILSVSDLGIGIKKSLAERYNVTSWNHATAIQNALQLGTSRLTDRGKGLYVVNEIVKKHKGKLIIRSCSGYVETGTNTFPSTVPYFPGTQIYIRL